MQGAFCVLNAKSQTRKSMKINVICTVPDWITINMLAVDSLSVCVCVLTLLAAW